MPSSQSTRRKTLHFIGSGALFSIAGCTSVRSLLSGSSSETFDPSDHVDDWQEESVQALGDPIKTETQIESSQTLERKCGQTARDAVHSAIQDRFDGASGYGYGLGDDPDGDHEYRVEVFRTMTVGRDGSVKQTPDVSFDDLRAATPRTAHATVFYNDSKYTCELRVFVEDRAIHEE